MIDKNFLDALYQFGVDQIEYSTRRLSDHLIGTHNLLESWIAPQETCPSPNSNFSFLNYQEQ